MIKIIMTSVMLGLGIVDKKLATKFQEEHHEILSRYRKAENADTSDYTDAELNITKEELLDFLKAYNNVLKTHSNNSN